MSVTPADHPLWGELEQEWVEEQAPRSITRHRSRGTTRLQPIPLVTLWKSLMPLPDPRTISCRGEPWTARLLSSQLVSFSRDVNRESSTCSSIRLRAITRRSSCVGKGGTRGACDINPFREESLSYASYVDNLHMEIFLANNTCAVDARHVSLLICPTRTTHLAICSAKLVRQTHRTHLD